MTPLPAVVVAGGTIECWRLEKEIHFPTWHAAIGAMRVGGRFSSPGRAVLYTSLDPATAILEVAVHKGFETLDVVPHRLLRVGIAVPAGKALVVQPSDVPNPNWLRPANPTPGQQAFGDRLLAAHGIVMIPSVVSSHSWNCLIDVASTPGLAACLVSDERFALDPRLAARPK
mgnify:CR=1 FL=1